MSVDTTPQNPTRVVGDLTTPEATFSRPADTTAYASGDLVANSTSAGSVAALAFASAARVAGASFYVRGCRLRKSGSGTTNASFRVHLYASAPVPANGDNGAWSTSKAADYLGWLDVTIDKAFSDGAVGFGVADIRAEIPVELAVGLTTIYALIEARAAYAPANAETFGLQLQLFRN